MKGFCLADFTIELANIYCRLPKCTELEIDKEFNCEKILENDKNC